MKVNFLSIFALLITFLLVGCDELTGSSTGANDSNGIFSIFGGLEGVAVGNNSYLLNGTAENGGNSGHNFRLQFELQNNETMSFYFFTSRQLDGGLKAIFSKKADKVTMTLELNGKSDQRELTKLEGLDLLDITLDVHNDHTDSHILVWETNGPKGDEEECTFEEECLYNTEDFALDAWLGVGKANGVFWGFEGKAESIFVLEGPSPPISDV